MTTATEGQAKREATSEHPVLGEIRFADTGVRLSTVAYWCDEEDRLHCMRSTEFPSVIAVADSHQGVINTFVQNLDDFRHMVAELDDNASPPELEAAVAIGERFMEAYREIERRHARRLFAINLGRRRRARRGNWSPISVARHAKSTPVSAV